MPWRRPVTFDLLARDKVFREEFDVDDRRYETFVEEYCEDVVEAFKVSAEAETAALPASDDLGSWAFHFTRYALTNIGVGLSGIQRGAIEEIVEVVLPRQVTVTDPAEADTIVPELTAFWMFLKRAYALPYADDALGTLAKYEPGFRERMLDPNNFGPAKSFFMAGHAAGYDMHNQADVQRYMMVYNASLESDAVARPPLSGLPVVGCAASEMVHKGKTSGQRKRKRQIAKASRKANRKRR